MCYVGRCACGAIRAATVDDPGSKRLVAQDVAEFIRGGLTIDRIEIPKGGLILGKCTCLKADPIPDGPSGSQEGLWL